MKWFHTSLSRVDTDPQVGLFEGPPANFSQLQPLLEVHLPRLRIAKRPPVNRIQFDAVRQVWLRQIRGRLRLRGFMAVARRIAGLVANRHDRKFRCASGGSACNLYRVQFFDFDTSCKQVAFFFPHVNAAQLKLWRLMFNGAESEF